ncbi:MAG: tRNA (guanosine(46)-N7)-methyltransferase TrmB [Campylobacteraceae bacterium]
MPNFHTSSFVMPALPCSAGDYAFLWEVTSKNSKLVLVKKGEEEFFIAIYKKDDTFLLKGEKITRPTKVLYLQEALSYFAKLSCSNLIYSNISPASNREFVDLDVLKTIDYFAKNPFTCKEDIFIEVGFGSGRHLLYQAKENPDKLIIGIEIHKPSIEQVIKQCKIQNIQNVILIDFDARILMEFLPSNSVSKIFVHFPVPWDKKPHRRVISRFFVDEAKRVLKEDGKLELRTDSDFYFEESLEIFKNTKDVNVEFFKNRDLDVSSKYEDRWKRMEKNIYDLTLTNHEKSDKIEQPSALCFDFLPKVDKIKEFFLNRKYVGEGFFAHFESLHVNDEKAVIKVAFGSSQRGEHSYILIDSKSAYYFPKTIYNTWANKESHKIISKWLNE